MTAREAHIRSAIDLAQRAVRNGNTPFGAILVHDGTVVRAAENTTVTEDDLTAHPELKLARWAGSDLGAAERAETTMYTSTEPCAMCAAAIYYAGLDRVVYSVASETLDDIRGDEGLGIPCREVFDRGGGETDVVGPVLESVGREVHETYYS